ncbi:glycosyltransferase [Aquibacillus sp. 3ASR75-11]|uniref:Glycosyltransferase n=1 Tax=Terrihalobacillus insolitus TaxID=2950438 RepID=A0A9X3WRF0_9BACI|nr:glycosyltransferase [Terrihalobacillus insolitus]MDC3423478.1 glycosyltransferase [Terrihalobacillus insolitus]
MKILYVSTLCSDEKFSTIFEKSNRKPQQQAQKFHKLLSKGLLMLGNTIQVISRPPTNEKLGEFKKTEDYKKIKFYYVSVLKNPLLRNISIFFETLINAFKWNLQNRKEEKFIICDVLNLSISSAALLSSKIFGTTTVAIVTDVPNYMDDYAQFKKKSLLKRVKLKINKSIVNFFMYRYDRYVILTEQMNKIVNPNCRPYVVVEGMVDCDMEGVPNSFDNKYSEKVIIYAGALKKKYGLDKLIKAFMKLNDKNARLWLFGYGDMESDIKHYELEDNRIKFHGVVPNNRVVNEQIKATLLVNPRPSSEEFTKYSFPSKNMEYMVSGTPVITTPLQGMPKVYNEYVYLFEDETIDGMANTLNKILKKSRKDLHCVGLNSKEFVSKEKNNIMQARKIMELERED